MIEYERRALDRAIIDLLGALSVLEGARGELTAVSGTDEDYDRLGEITIELREMGQRWHTRLQEAANG